MSNYDAMSTFIHFENLSKSYQEGTRQRVVLENASAHFQQGEFSAILGKSGTGKSTLLNLISGIDYPDAGAIWMDGQNLTGMDEHSRTLFRRNHIGFIFQFFNLIPTLTVWENVILPLELAETGFLQKRDKPHPNGKKAGMNESREQAASLLDAVGLLDRRETFPDRLSGGQQQRVAIARALVHDPLLVLADEPTGNLDEETGQQVLDLLDRLTRQRGKNLILVTHSTDAAGYADRVLHLKDGKFLEQVAEPL